MPLDVSLSAVVNAAGALLFAVVGLGILLIARGARRAVLIGALATAFGFSYVVQNIWTYDGSSRAPAIAFVAGALATAVLASVLAAEYARELSPPRRKWAAALAVAAITGLFFFGAYVGLRTIGGTYSGIIGQPVRDTWTTLMALSLNLTAIPLATLAGIIGLRVRGAAGNPPGPDRGIMLLGLAFGTWAVFNGMADAVGRTSSDTLYLGLGFALGFVPIAAIATHRGGAFLALGATALCGIALVAVTGSAYGDLGVYGVVRTIGAALLVIAIVRYDLLGMPLPRFVVKRGALAAGTLALLLIVAQIAQNFLAAQYGLLMGGVVAGAFLFAAAPVQRAMESMRERAPAQHGAVPAASAAPAREHEAIYRNALRVALRDKRLTRDEEIHLHELATALGIPAAKAHALLVAVERESGEP